MAIIVQQPADEDLVLVRFSEEQAACLSGFEWHRDRWDDLPLGRRQKYILEHGAKEKAEAAPQVSLLTKALRDTGLHEAGYRAGLAKQFQRIGDAYYYGDRKPVAARLMRARERVTLAGADPLLMTEDVVLLWLKPSNDLLAWISLLGEPEVRVVSKFGMEGVLL